MKKNLKKFIFYILIPVGTIYHILLGILLFIYKTPYATFENNFLNINGILKLSEHLHSSFLHVLLFIFPLIAFPSAIALYLKKKYHFDSFSWKKIITQSLLLLTISIFIWWIGEFILNLTQFQLSTRFIIAWLLILPFSMIRIIPMFIIILIEIFLLKIFYKIKQKFRVRKHINKHLLK